MSVSQSGQLGLEAGILERVEGREVEEEIFGIHPLGMGSERIGRPKQIVCYRAGHETGGGGLDLEKQETCAYLFPDRIRIGSAGEPAGLGAQAKQLVGRGR